jgi:diguanylate cyclase (GGDEF)-like protein
MVAQVDNLATLVQSSFSIASPSFGIQPLIQVYSRRQVAHSDMGIDVLFVVNPDGKIAYSSRPAWLNLMIFDGIFSSSSFDNPFFREIASCFQKSKPDCVSLRSDDYSLFRSSLTASRPVSQLSSDLGLPRENYLLVAVYSGNIILSALVQELLPLLVLAIVLASLLTSALWFLMRAVLLPRLSQAAQTDGLTQLMNRAAFMECAMDVLAEAEDHGGDLVFAIMDVDHFKRINDSYGHDCGDVALVSVSAVLSTVMRESDYVCRFGGEEFALLLAVNQEAGRKVLERLRLQIEMSRVAYDGREIPVTVSIGAACTAECGYNLDYLYTFADRCLYAAKQGGRNRVEWAKSESVARLQFNSPLLPFDDVPKRLPASARSDHD